MISLMPVMDREPVTFRLQQKLLLKKYLWRRRDLVLEKELTIELN